MKMFVTVSKIKPFFVKCCNALRFKIIRNFYMISEINKNVLILFNMKNYSNISVNMKQNSCVKVN